MSATDATIDESNELIELRSLVRKILASETSPERLTKFDEVGS